MQYYGVKNCNILRKAKYIKLAECNLLIKKHCNSKRAFEMTSELEQLAKLWQSKGNMFPL